MRARLLAALAALSIAVLPTTLLPASPASAQEPGTAAAAELPEIEMTCRVGQVDINHASVTELKTALNVDTSVAKRVVGFRPYLQPKDLLVVQGIGADKLATILAARSACATPTQFPPPASQRCTSTSRVDLAAAPAEELTARLGLSAPNAAKVIAARPFATLRHVTPERVPGVGKGILDMVVSKSCLTPSPVRTATSSWRWAYPSQTTTVTRGAYALMVPVGVVDDPGGAWASITDATAQQGFADDPAADFHIWGAWADGTQTVAATLPGPDDLTGAADAGLAPLVIHHTDGRLGNAEFFAGPNLKQDKGTLTVQLTTLSLLEGILAPIRIISAPTAVPTGRQLLLQRVQEYLGLTADQPTCPPFASNADTLRMATSGGAIDKVLDEGGRRLLKWCGGPGPNDTARWIVANNSGAVISVNTQGKTRIVDYKYGGDLLTDALYDVWNYTEKDGGVVQVDLPPGTSAVLEAPAGTVSDKVGFGTNELLAVPTFLSRQLGVVLPEEKADVLSLLRECGVTEVTGFAGDEVSSRDLFKCVLNIATVSSKPKSLLRRIDSALLVADLIIDTSNTLAVQFGGPWDMFLTWRLPAPPTPPGQPGNGDLDNPDSPKPVRLLKISGSPASYVLDSDRVAHHVPDGGTYQCNAKVMPTQFELGAVTDEANSIGSDAGCPDGVAERSLNPDAVREFLLREPDGSSWLIDDDGYRQKVLGVGGFECFAKRYLVWDLATDDEVARFPTYPGVVGTFCDPVLQP